MRVGSRCDVLRAKGQGDQEQGCGKACIESKKLDPGCSRYEQEADDNADAEMSQKQEKNKGQGHEQGA